MNFQKNQFFKTEPTKIAGNKILPNNNPFEISKRILNQNRGQVAEEKPMTPERRLEEQRNQKHFLNRNPFQK